MKSSEKKNRLSQESSPYLLQHAENPVDWYPWGEEAFTRAGEEDKPVFLSIGYSTCHWCHVMERECFDDDEVAELMNRSFISIKVDREERPEIDSLYMSAAMLLTGGGGWPLNLLLTPDRKPFFAATYISKNSMGQRIGMTDLVPRIEEAWKNRRTEVLNAAESVMDALRRNAETPDESTKERVFRLIDKDAGPSPIAGVIQKGFNSLIANFDREHGGFGGAPKFPQPHVLRFLLKAGEFLEGREEAVKAVEKTLRHMRAGGIYDHLGFGFHRYSTDREWKVPHFEKMLYDQALLISTYLDASTAAGKQAFATTAEEIIQYLLRDMRSQEGGFYSAEDADSEGVEGKFYLWETDGFREIVEDTLRSSRPGVNEEEIKGAVAAYTNYFHVEEEGNYREEHPGVGAASGPPEPERQNILFTNPEYRELPGTFEEFEKVRKELLSTRDRRVRPFLDDKVLTDWNGFVILALAKAGRVLENPTYIETAGETADFLLSTLRAPNEGENITLYHRYRNGKAGISGTLDDYAFLIAGLLELYKSGGDLKYVKSAIGLAAVVEESFQDKTTGGCFTTGEKSSGNSEESGDILVRQKEGMDNAIPSGNSLMLGNLITLYHITGDGKYRESAEALINAFSESLNEHPTAHTWMLSEAMGLLKGLAEVVVCGKEKEAAAYIAEVHRNLPESVVLRKTSEDAAALAEIAPFTEAYPVPEKGAAVYICSDFTCRRPITDLDALKQEMSIDQQFTL